MLRFLLIALLFSTPVHAQLTEQHAGVWIATDRSGTYFQVSVVGTKAIATLATYDVEANRKTFGLYVFDVWQGADSYAPRDAALIWPYIRYEPPVARAIALGAGLKLELREYGSQCSGNTCQTGYFVVDTIPLFKVL